MGENTKKGLYGELVIAPEEYGVILRDIRERNGLTIKQVSQFLGLGEGNYSLKETGKRPISTKEEFLYIVNRIYKEVDALDKDVEKGYYCLSESKYEKAKELIGMGHNLVKTAVAISVDEDLLRNRLRKDNIEYEEFSLVGI